MKTDDAVCVCGHPRLAHEHLRKGSDCSFCGADRCPRFRRKRWWRPALTDRAADAGAG
jgi:hypothetical protein